MVLRRWSTALGAAILSLTAIANARADVRLPRVISDNMVLQQKKPIHIWGWAAEGEKVTVKFNGRTATTRAQDGKWSVMLAPVAAGGPWTMTIAGKNTISLENILVGEVWVCSGQSNMQFPLVAAANGKEAVAEANDPELRLFEVAPASNLIADDPKEDLPTGSWTATTPATAPGFSAVGYFCARALRQALHVPVGMINVSWGGTAVEPWTSRPALQAEHAYNYIWRNAANAPSVLYNGMIAPITPFAIEGALWYQGESNAGDPTAYRTRFPGMIENWRAVWNVGDFPFLLVQLAPFMKINSEPEESNWAALREAQTLATKVLPRVGMAVITDVGEEKDIHPRKKQPVGERLALLARKIAYHQKIVASGPTYRSMHVAGNRAILRFGNVGAGLEVHGDKLTGFAIAGKDHKFVWANAVIEGATVVVSSPEVARPTAVRYGWANFPVVNLWNKDGLPADPFRTDAPTE